MIRGETTDAELTLTRHGADHFALERTDFARIQWASLEGSGEDMLAVATAIEQRTPAHAKRVALRWHESGDGLLWSPRNSMSESRIPVARLDAVVPIIRRVVAEPPGDPDSRDC